MNHLSKILLAVFLFYCVCIHAQTDENTANAKTVTFVVSSVQQAPKPLTNDTVVRIFEYKTKKKLLFYHEDKDADYGLVHCYNNGFIETIQECYSEHRPLILTPDDVWLTICQGVSLHIKEHYDSLKKYIFVKDKPKELILRNDNLDKGEKYWNELIAGLSDKTRKYTKADYYSFFVSNFTTTNAPATTAYQVTLLESYKKEFSYAGESGCGIPTITLKGTKQDWETILAKLDKLNTLGLAYWAAEMRPLLKEFINAYDNKVNKEFWQSIYKDAVVYGAHYVSGWVIKFFPYVQEKDYSAGPDTVTWVFKTPILIKKNPFMDEKRYLMSTLTTDNFPSGIAKINIRWDNYFKNTKTDMEVCAGFFAMKQYKDKSLEPYISWAVCDDKAKLDENYYFEYDERADVKHNGEFWYPELCKEPNDSAMYNTAKFKTQKAGVDYIRTRLLDSLSHSGKYKGADLKNDTLQFVIYTTGDLGSIALTGKKHDVALTNYLKTQLQKMPDKWFPALTEPYGWMEMMVMENRLDRKIKVKVNSVVKIVF